MIAFEVYLNGTKICTAGMGDLGVLSSILTWRGLQAYKDGVAPSKDSMVLDVGGLIIPSGEQVRWQEHRAVQIGDEVSIKIVEVEEVDPPPIRRQPDPAKDEESQKLYVRKMANQLGWRIQET